MISIQMKRLQEQDFPAFMISSSPAHAEDEMRSLGRLEEGGDGRTQGASMHLQIQAQDTWASLHSKTALEVQDTTQAFIYQVYHWNSTKSALLQESSVCFGQFESDPKARLKYTCAQQYKGSC